MISSVSLVSMQMGNASTPPRYLKRSALPSITGMLASARLDAARFRRLVLALLVVFGAVFLVRTFWG